MLKLREYQEDSLSMLNAWWSGHDGNPCIVLPTGAGKTLVIASFCQRTLAMWPETRIMILCSQKELVEQDSKKLLAMWPEAPLGVCCAAMRKKELGRQVTVSSILSVYRQPAEKIGVLSLILVDEAHLINHKDEGAYRIFIDAQKAKNPHLRVIGLTATPYRLGHGMITDGDALFQAPLIEPTSIPDLQAKGFLCMLRSKSTTAKISAEGVSIRGGEYVERELQLVVDDQLTSGQVVGETITKAGERRHWLFFCCGISHARHVCDILNDKGISAACVTGDTPQAEREDILDRFKAGTIKAVTNANVLTTGFDFPGIDLIVMMRPTMSPGLYVQMAGRGLRIDPEGIKKDCLVLDYAGNVSTHGPITHVQPPGRKGTRQGVAPSKICPECDEIIPASAKVCPCCGYIYPLEERRFCLSDEDIMGIEPSEMEVESWEWHTAVSRTSSLQMLVCRFYGFNLSDPVLNRYYCLWHEGYAGAKALKDLKSVAREAGVSDLTAYRTEDDLLLALNQSNPPSSVYYRRQGKFFQIIGQEWREYVNSCTKEKDKRNRFDKGMESSPGVSPMLSYM